MTISEVTGEEGIVNLKALNIRKSPQADSFFYRSGHEKKCNRILLHERKLYKGYTLVNKVVLLRYVAYKIKIFSGGFPSVQRMFLHIEKS